MKHNLNLRKSIMRFSPQNKNWDVMGKNGNIFKSVFHGEITEQKFLEIFGVSPIEDDLQRVNCEHAGEIGHSHCGICLECKFPNFCCQCRE